MKKARWLRHLHAASLAFWLVMVPVSIVTGLLGSVEFIAACSIYANAAAHFAAWQGARAETENGNES